METANDSLWPFAIGVYEYGLLPAVLKNPLSSVNSSIFPNMHCEFVFFSTFVKFDQSGHLWAHTQQSPKVIHS